MKAETEATIEDLYHVPENGKAEIVDGELVIMSPTQKLPNYAAGEIFVSLHQYSRRTKRGQAATGNLGFLVDLPHRKSFSPDVAFYNEEVNTEFGAGAPIFAVEVRSKGDYGSTAERKIARKIADYFAAGTQVVWDVDLLGEDIVRVYRGDNPTQASLHRRGDMVDAEPALPGWSMPVDDLFPASNP